MHDSENPHFTQSHAPSEIWSYAPISAKNYQGAQSVYRVKDGDIKQRMWFVLDHGLILPEYLVEFEYETPSQDNEELNIPSDIKELNKETSHIFAATNEAQKILQNTYLNPQVKEGLKGTSFHISAQDLDRSDMG
jgi:hypothetical protein